MTRYIDADKLKEDILEENSWYLYNEFGSTTQFHELIDKQPTVDALEVVRCKDCKWYKKIVEKSKSGLCHYDLVAMCLHDEDYCSHGEWRE